MHITPNAQAFIEANAKSPVVSGWALEQNPHRPPRGIRYVLDDGSKFTLTPEECGMVTPDWGFGDMEE